MIAHEFRNPMPVWEATYIALWCMDIGILWNWLPITPKNTDEGPLFTGIKLPSEEDIIAMRLKFNV